MWIYILIIFIVVYSIFKEREALGCPSNPLNGKDCDNDSGKAVKGSNPSEEDNTFELLDKIKYASCYNSRFVRWRGIFLASFFGTLLLWFIIFQKIPNEWELSCGILVLFVIFSCVNRFYLFHVSKCIEDNITGSVDILEERYYKEKCESKEDYKVYYPYHNIDYESNQQTSFLV